ncbi:hypothetical protein [Trinickia acidisoli]|uniref:hypothetical protein n=1 Tax=Trinickia acidisoli TaxID=2767482 RepID=UPI001A8CDB06|nr:hypothetical protein [Trinickia acidisoli]
MRDQTAHEPKFPTACARCGGRISEPVAFCPHCGAHARFALTGDAPHASSAERAGFVERGGPAAHAGSARREPYSAAAAASVRAEPTVPVYDFEGDLDPPWPGPPTPLFASPDGDPYGEVHAGAFRGTRQWGLKGGTGLVVAAFVLLYGGAVLVHRRDDTSSVSSSMSSSVSQQSASKSVEGAIGSNEDNAATFAAPTNGGALQPPAPFANGNGAVQAPSSNDAAARANSVPPSDVTLNNTAPAPKAGTPMSPNTAIASLPPPVAPVQVQPSGVDEQGKWNRHAHGYAREANARAFEGDAAITQAKPKSQPQPREARTGHAAFVRALDSAQVRFAKSDLRGARASLASALAADPNNGDALALRDQLVSREQQRDASLGAARACVVASRWNCVWHNAGKALAIDASSTEAKALVDRAIVESGAATTPAGPGPDNVAVPMVQ